MLDDDDEDEEDISIHAPRKGERLIYGVGHFKQGGFQSTLPARGSDLPLGIVVYGRYISIHAPRKGERLIR